MNLRFFTGQIKTVEDLKKTYRQLAIKHHPDAGGKHEDFIKMREEYEYLLERIQKGSTNWQDTKHSASDGFREVIDGLMGMNINVEIIGSWIWASGNETRYHKEELKNLGFRWSKSKKSWYWIPEDQRNEGYTRAKHNSLESIRNTWGSQTLQEEQEREKLAR